jgi:hypothetical protein
VTNSARLRQKVELFYPSAYLAERRIWEDPAVDRLYPELLCWMHAVSRATVPMMAAAEERAHELAARDVVAARMVEYLAKHIAEERGHDEWIRQDLAALGLDPDEPVRRVPPPVVASLVGAQYYWIAHHHPAALLGFLAVVEGYPPRRGLDEEVAARTGYPREAFRSIRRHAHLAIKHRDDFSKFFDSLRLGPEHEEVIEVSALHTVAQSIAMYEQIHAAVDCVDAERLLGNR